MRNEEFKMLIYDILLELEKMTEAEIFEYHKEWLEQMQTQGLKITNCVLKLIDDIIYYSIARKTV